MKTSSLELLEKTQLPPAQARAILQVMESELAVRDSALASRADLRDGLHDLELKLVREIKGSAADTLRWNFAFGVAQLAAIAGMLKLLK